MWIEEMYGDFKKHGFDLESTMLRLLALVAFDLGSGYPLCLVGFRWHLHHPRWLAQPG